MRSCAIFIGSPTELVGQDGRISWYRTESLWGDELAVRALDGTACPLRFPGQYHDRETGLHYNFHRYYDPATARYLSPDPVGLTPSANHYTYVVNPLVVCDPLGLASHHGPDGRFAVDPSGVPIPRNQLTRVDANGNIIPFEELTYDHNPAVVQHWIESGHNQTRAQREAWYYQTDNMEAMSRSENSRRGAMLKERFSDRPPGPNYSCS
ncbi:RHS repeat domain-containing protein [Streptoalloteichus tenebrarius]|nr:RHS repeat-associated core domain-containing protein [Streptoalloteichus tenebrarius]